MNIWRLDEWMEDGCELDLDLRIQYLSLKCILDLIDTNILFVVLYDV